MQLHDVKGKVDFAIITILEEERQAVLACFQGEPVELPSLVYEFRRVPVRDGSKALVAIARASQQGRVDRGGVSPAPHRSGRAGFPHPALRLMGSLRVDGCCGLCVAWAVEIASGVD